MKSTAYEANKYREKYDLLKIEDIYINDISDVKPYLMRKNALNFKFILMHLDINNRLISEEHIVTRLDFRSFCLKLTQLFILYNTAKVVIVRVNRHNTGFNKTRDYHYRKRLLSLAKLFGVKLLDYIVMNGDELESNINSRKEDYDKL